MKNVILRYIKYIYLVFLFLVTSLLSFLYMLLILVNLRRNEKLVKNRIRYCKIKKVYNKKNNLFIFKIFYFSLFYELYNFIVTLNIRFLNDIFEIEIDELIKTSKSSIFLTMHYGNIIPTKSLMKLNNKNLVGVIGELPFKIKVNSFFRFLISNNNKKYFNSISKETKLKFFSADNISNIKKLYKFIRGNNSVTILYDLPWLLVERECFDYNKIKINYESKKFLRIAKFNKKPIIGILLIPKNILFTKTRVKKLFEISYNDLLDKKVYQKIFSEFMNYIYENPFLWYRWEFYFYSLGKKEINNNIISKNKLNKVMNMYRINKLKYDFKKIKIIKGIKSYIVVSELNREDFYFSKEEYIVYKKIVKNCKLKDILKNKDINAQIICQVFKKIIYIYEEDVKEDSL